MQPVAKSKKIRGKINGPPGTIIAPLAMPARRQKFPGAVVEEVPPMGRMRRE